MKKIQNINALSLQYTSERLTRNVNSDIIKTENQESHTCRRNGKKKRKTT